MLVPPANAKLIELKSSTVWFDEAGILYSVSKKTNERTIEEIKAVMEQFKQIAGGRKFCMVIDLTHSSPSDRQAREYAATELPKLVTAMAMVSGSALGRMIANLFLALKPTPYPAKIFGTVEEAQAWLKQYL